MGDTVIASEPSRFTYYELHKVFFFKICIMHVGYLRARGVYSFPPTFKTTGDLVKSKENGDLQGAKIIIEKKGAEDLILSE